MAKRTKVTASHTSLRLPPDLLVIVQKASEGTGWSMAKTVAFYSRLGAAIVNGPPGLAKTLHAQFDGAIALHRVELENARRLAEARAAVRAVIAAPHVRKPRPAAAGSTRKPSVPKLPDSKPNAAA